MYLLFRFRLCILILNALIAQRKSKRFLPVRSEVQILLGAHCYDILIIMNSTIRRNSDDYTHRMLLGSLLNDKLFNSFSIRSNDGSDHYSEEYKNEFNSFGFRSDEFTNKHNGKHILFMGCSETQGSNEDLNSCWAYILYNKIKTKENVSGYFNIASIGSGIIPQIMKAQEYIKKFGKPDEILFLSPEPYRTLKYSKTDARVEHSNITPEVYEECDISDMLEIFSYNATIIQMFESFCETLNIKLLWSTWASHEEYIFDGYGFKNYFNLHMTNVSLENLYELYADESRTIDNNFLKKDKHKGIVFHRYWAEKFYQERLNEKNNKKD
jgi:hypothetical protein